MKTRRRPGEVLRPADVAAAAVREEAQKFFRSPPCPPLVLMEWESACRSRSSSCGRGAMTDVGPAVEFLTPPGMTRRPYFAAWCASTAARSFSIGGITAGRERAELTDAELQDTFAQLRYRFWNRPALTSAISSRPLLRLRCGREQAAQ